MARPAVWPHRHWWPGSTESWETLKKKNGLIDRGKERTRKIERQIDRERGVGQAAGVLYRQK